MKTEKRETGELLPLLSEFQLEKSSNPILKAIKKDCWIEIRRTQISESTISHQEEPMKAEEEAVEMTKSSDGDGKTNKNAESHKEKEEMINEMEAENEKKEMEFDSPSRDVEKSSSFKVESNLLSDLKANEKKRLSELKENVEKVFEIAKDADGDAKTNKIEEPIKENEEKIKEMEAENEKNSSSFQEADSSSRIVKNSSSFKEDCNLRYDPKDDENAFFEMKAKVEDGDAKTNEIAKVADGDTVTNEIEEPNKENEEKIKEMGEGDEKKKKKVDIASLLQVGVKSFSFKEESNLLWNLKDNEKALFELKEKVEEAILQKRIFNKEQAKLEHKESDEDKLKEKSAEECEEKENAEMGAHEKAIKEVERDVTLWGVPLLPSKGAESTNVVLMKFLRAQEFSVEEAFEMLENTLRWREEYRIDSILDEDLGCDFSSVAYMEGMDREGHPVCYNIYGIFEDEKLFNKTFGMEENCNRLLRWRLQLMEREIKKLNFEPGGVSSFLQINDLKNSPGPSRKELRLAMKHAITLLQDNYPEFVSTNVFINVPFWYYAVYALLSPFLTQRTKSKFVFARPSKVTETLLKYIPAEDIPVRYGGLKRERDAEFSLVNGSILELTVKAGSTGTVEIPAPEIGSTALWDLTVLGWEVTYKEEFVPTDEKSYTLIVRKEKKMASHEQPTRNSFKNKEPGKVILTVENATFKKKRVLYRYKVTCPYQEE